VRGRTICRHWADIFCSLYYDVILLPLHGAFGKKSCLTCYFGHQPAAGFGCLDRQLCTCSRVHLLRVPSPVSSTRQNVRKIR